MKKCLYLFAFIIFLLSMPINANVESETNRIAIVSNGEEYEPYSNFLNAIARTENGGYVGVTGLPPVIIERLFENLIEIKYAKDFQIIIEGIYATSETTFRYMLYNDKLECVFDNVKVENFTFPNEAGVYILKIESFWESGFESSRSEHCFKINTAIEISPMTGDNFILINSILLFISYISYKYIKLKNKTIQKL